ncbi:anaphase-promoting complex subunit TPR lobe accessory factor Hcn1/Apc12 [Schizosaccharomyces osmophilus]|uniref:Anaphase-promoting complex subunit TPR lobe accessory factor Hcn1/Apc12 n=1 Tax=Schizosaccharomyces osmophilus TaxID=2545709 RepID=A0AAF0AY01_9SCHI|nr:anaphase-promoting complex subunit TPR lobe accessory factor Hcn1/Apc12 [Schizosaccharomyces osmophilus]WBW74239.1 anaphase-promoting complex subunit TPR lobe accessory factor Hcn1/Apc12 [Schizosaccharomyces osmophilus]
MLRKQPTAIQITAEDVFEYDDEKLKENHDFSSPSHNVSHRPKDTFTSMQEKKNLSKERRIGIAPGQDQYAQP